MQTVSVLGTGWLGMPLTAALVNSGCQVRASTRSAEKLADIIAQKAEPHIVDIDNWSDDMGTFLQSNILIINITSKNVTCFKRLLAAIESSPIEKVLFVSSTSVYENKNMILHESDGCECPEKPLFIVEQLFSNSAKFATTLVRFGGLIGGSRHPGRFFRSGKRVKDPDGYVNLIHRDDCIAIIMRILKKSIWHEVFNCCADTHPTKREYYSKAAQSIGYPVPEFESPSVKSYKIISNAKVKRVLDYQFQHADLMEIDYL